MDEWNCFQRKAVWFLSRKDQHPDNSWKVNTSGLSSPHFSVCLEEVTESHLIWGTRDASKVPVLSRAFYIVNSCMRTKLCYGNLSHILTICWGELLGFRTVSLSSASQMALCSLGSVFCFFFYFSRLSCQRWSKAIMIQTLIWFLKFKFKFKIKPLSPGRI